MPDSPPDAASLGECIVANVDIPRSLRLCFQSLVPLISVKRFVLLERVWNVSCRPSGFNHVRHFRNRPPLTLRDALRIDVHGC